MSSEKKKLEDEILEENQLEEEINTESKKENEANEDKEKENLNKSRTNTMCNHCLYVSKTYEEMKEHYKSEFHKYNLNRVTMNLAPLSYEDYKRKKEFFMKKMEEKKKAEEKLKTQNQNLYCEICSKKFNSSKKLEEHLTSKTHLKNKAKKEENKDTKEISTINEEIKEKEETKTTLDDITICLFCNYKSDTLKNNFYHMVQKHELEIPFIFYIKNYEELIKLLSKKIFVYHACFTCDTQRFETIKALQSHMLSKGHTTVNYKDLDEILFKYYDLKKLLAIKDTNIRRSKEFKILSLRAKVAKELKEKNLEGDDEWEEVKSDEDNEEDYEPMTLPNGELLLQNGSTLGNKDFKIYYKQKFHANKYENLQKEHKIRNKERNLRLKRRDQIRKNIKRNVNYKIIKGSNKGNFVRINKLTVMRPQIALV